VTRALANAVQNLLGVRGGVGFAGTLDPAASGVVLLAIGRATSLLPYLPGEKAYEGTVKFGVSTDSWDSTGSVTEVRGLSEGGPPPLLPSSPSFSSSSSSSSSFRSRVERDVLPRFVGRIEQVPPGFSAVRVGGVRAHKIARMEGPERAQELMARHKRRTVDVSSIRVLGWCGGGGGGGGGGGEAAQSGSDSCACAFPELTIEVRCGPGTYIRSLAVDIGAAAGGIPSTLSALVRTEAAGFSLRDSTPLPALLRGGRAEVERRLLPLDGPFRELPRVFVAQGSAAQTSWNSGTVFAGAVEGGLGAGVQRVRVYDDRGGKERFIGLAEEVVVVEGERPVVVGRGERRLRRLVGVV
jgi:tRNA pseudouridine55 synthase